MNTPLPRRSDRVNLPAQHPRPFKAGVPIDHAELARSGIRSGARDSGGADGRSIQHNQERDAGLAERFQEPRRVIGDHEACPGPPDKLPGPHRLVRLDVDGKDLDLESVGIPVTGGVVALDACFQLPRGDLARGAPGGEEIEENDLAGEVVQPNPLA